MNLTPLTPEELSALEVATNHADFHHDLLAYLDYVSVNSIYRKSRDETFSKMVLKDLFRLFTSPLGSSENKNVNEAWLYFVAFLAEQLKLTDSDADSGDSDLNIFWSMGNSENYVVINRQNYAAFLQKSPEDQEAAIREELIKIDYKNYAELLDTSPLGRLDSFPDWLRVASVLKEADWSGARQKLLASLAQLPSGVWLPVSGLLQAFKQEQPYFFLPKNVHLASKRLKAGRYAGLLENLTQYNERGKEINEADPDAFERVEGRFMERFFEFIPFLLRYVELAYDSKPYHGLYPMRGVLRAFRISDRLIHQLKKTIPPAQMTVQPNFEVVVVAEVYPAKIMRLLESLGNVMHYTTGQSGPSVITVLLKREKVVAAVAADDELDVIAALAGLSNQKLAQNVVAELREWTALSSAFTLYEGFGLLEAPPEMVVDGASKDLRVRISPQMGLYARPERVYSLLKKNGLAPLRITHEGAGLQELPAGVTTVFSTEDRPLRPPVKLPSFTLQREEVIALRVSDSKQAFAALKAALLEAGCPLEIDEASSTLRYPRRYDTLLNAVMAKLADYFQVKVTGLPLAEASTAQASDLPSAAPESTPAAAALPVKPKRGRPKSA